MPPRHQRFARFLMLASGILVALFIAEAGLRISGFTYFNPYTVDLDLGYSHRPGAEGWWKREGITYVRINSHGFRDRERTLAKPPRTLRIAVLGDSFAEAFQVPLEKAFMSIIESKLRECPNVKTPVEVLNFGVSGFSTSRELILLRKRVWSYSPDIVVLLFTVGNDVRDNSRTLSEYKREPLPYFTLHEGKLVLDDSLLAERNRGFSFRLRPSIIGRAFNWVQDHSRVLGLIYTARESYHSSKAAASEGQSPPGAEFGLDSNVYSENHNDTWKNAWQVTEGLIRMMRDEVTAQGAKFLVVTGSTSIQVHPDPSVRQRFMAQTGTQNLFYPDERIKALGQREGIEVLNLALTLADYAGNNRVALHGSGANFAKGHWNERGHQLVGELIAERLCKTID